MYRTNALYYTYRAFIQVQILPVAPKTITFTMSDIYRDSIFWVEVDRIEPNPYQPRREFDQAKLNGLAESIRMYGLLQPLTVTRNETTKDDGGINVFYELIAGERRLRASKLAGLVQVPVIIRSEEDTDQMKLELAIIENLQREDLNPVDRAQAFLRLHKDFNFTHVQIGKKMGKSREYVSNTLRLLMLPEAILGYLAEGRISEGHTRPLLMLNDKPEEQSVLAKEILLKKLTVRESEALARRSAQEKVSAKHKINPEVLNLERKLTEKLGTRVQIEQKEVGGKLVISFFSAEDLSELLNAMRLEKEKEGVSTIFNGNPKAPTEDLSKKAQSEKQESQETPAVEEPKVAEETKVENTEQDTQQQDVPAPVATTEQSPVEEAAVTEPEVVTEPNPVATFAATEKEDENDAAASHPLLNNSANLHSVEPSPERPMPETATSSTVDTFAPTEASPAVSEVKEEMEDEEVDLYAIRNFSI